jgi:hypothetical protein
VLENGSVEDSNLTDLHLDINQRNRSLPVLTTWFLRTISTSFVFTLLIGTKTARKKEVLCMYNEPVVKFKHLDKLLCKTDWSTDTLLQEKYSTNELLLESFSSMKKSQPHLLPDIIF